LNIIAFGAHPDDCEIKFGGTAAKLARAGHAVKFVSVTDGRSGHHVDPGPGMAARRRAEAMEAGRRLGIAEYEVFDNADGALLATLEARDQVIRAIRRWNADIVIAPRPNDYHPDHRYTSILVQDAAYMVLVPYVTADTPALRRNPVFLYFEDHFQRPVPFRADISVPLDDVREVKLDGIDAHVSQVYEWLPWVAGREAPSADPSERKRWLAEMWKAYLTVERFELCEYGRQELPEIFK
jgi:LmbE family N-acetylglucosaminyl deacetylase